MTAQVSMISRISIDMGHSIVIHVWIKRGFNLWCWRAALFYLGYELRCRHNRTKEMCSISVSYSKLLLFLAVYWLCKYGVLLLTKYVCNWRTRWKHFRHEICMCGCLLASGWLFVWLRPCNAWYTVLEWSWLAHEIFFSRDRDLMDGNINVMKNYSKLY
jgi:hypothetical protein